MQETKRIFEANDGAKIYGVLNTLPENKQQRLLIIIHGLTGSYGDYAAIRAAHELPAQGFDVLRINLYDGQQGARCLTDTSFSIHGADIDTVVAVMKQQYQQIAIAGHSHGGPSILHADTNNFAAISLWDPTYPPADYVRVTNERCNNRAYIIRDDVEWLYGDAYLAEVQALDAVASQKLAAKVNVPLQVITAGNSSLFKAGEPSYSDFISGLSERVIVEDARHTFIEYGACDMLLSHVVRWLKQHML